MSSVTRYRQYAAECLRQAQTEEDASGDKTIMLNVALAWLRLAQQTEAIEQADIPPPALEFEQHELTS